jgi:hypothetical protein
MPGTTHVHSNTSSTETPTARAIRDGVDPERTVWFAGGVAYHRAAPWGPACPDMIGRAQQRTLAEAADEDKRPCKQCDPVDYRPTVTDGGQDVHDVPGHGRLGGVDDPTPRAEYGDVDEKLAELAAHEHANELEAALDYAMEAAERAADRDVDDIATARLKLAECGARQAFYATSESGRDLFIDDARVHLEIAVDTISDVDVTHPARHALQHFVSHDERHADPEPAPRAPSPTTSTTSGSFIPLNRTTAASLAVLAGFAAGRTLAEVDFISSAETSAGEALVVTSTPGAPFWAAFCFLFAGALLAGYATMEVSR